jgi:hypothetical protein
VRFDDPGFDAFAKGLLGSQVRVTLNPGDPLAIASGRLLSFTNDGETCVQYDDGVIHWCWPMLYLEEVS